MADTERNNSLKRTNGDRRDTSEPVASTPRPKRPKTSKACNACRKQKSRCERLSGDSDACHRCGVIGITCIFDSEPPSTDLAKARKPRPLLPREAALPNGTTSKADPIAIGRIEGRSTPQNPSPDNTGLHVLANTTEMLSRESNSRSTNNPALHRDSISSSRPTATPKSTLSPETLSTVESALFPQPRDSTSESEAARFRADWRRWVAPLTMLQALVRRNRVSIRPMDVNTQHTARPIETGAITPAQERRLREHFRLCYVPWLPAVRLPEDVSPFLTTIICATAARTLGEISATSMEHLRSLALHHVGQVFASPSAHPLVESLYAFLVLVLWPLDAADDVALLVNGAKQLASSHDRGQGVFSGASHTSKTGRNLDHTRLWYTICASETILRLGAGSTTPPLPLDELALGLGSASDLAWRSGCVSDVLLILQTSLHRIVTAAMGEKGFFTAQKGAPPLLNGRETLLHYISTVHMFLTRLGEWELEFYSISSEAERSDTAYYAALEIEYHYLRLMLVTHCILVLCHVCPLTSASDEIKFALWSWSITGNKSAYSIVRLFNQFSRSEDPQEALPPLASAPDRIFAMVVVAVMLILRHQVAAYEYGRRRGQIESPPAGFTKQGENAIRRAILRMESIGRLRSVVDGTPPDSAAARYVEILEALLRIWEEQRAQKVASVAIPPVDACTSPGEPFQPRKNVDSQAAQIPMPEQLHQGTSGNMGTVPMDLDLSLLGGDLFSDAAFPWDGLGTFDWAGAGQ